MARAAFEEARVTIPPASLFFRTTLEDFELEGVALMSIRKCLVSSQRRAGIRRTWADPDRFDINAARDGESDWVRRGHSQLCRADDGAPWKQKYSFAHGPKGTQQIELADRPQVRLQPGLRGLSSLRWRLVRKSR